MQFLDHGDMPFELCLSLHWKYHRCCGGFCVAMSCGGWSFTPDGTFDSVWDYVMLMIGRYTIFISCTKGTFEYVCMLNDWDCSFDEIFADNFNSSQFRLNGKCRSGKLR